MCDFQSLFVGLYPFILSYLNTNWGLMVFNSIEINRPVCVTLKKRQRNLAAIIDHCSVLFQVNLFLLHLSRK